MTPARDVRRCYVCGKGIAWGAEVFMTDGRGARHFGPDAPLPPGWDEPVEQITTEGDCMVILRGVPT